MRGGGVPPVTEGGSGNDAREANGTPLTAPAAVPAEHTNGVTHRDASITSDQVVDEWSEDSGEDSEDGGGGAPAGGYTLLTNPTDIHPGPEAHDEDGEENIEPHHTPADGSSNGLGYTALPAQPASVGDRDAFSVPEDGVADPASWLGGRAAAAALARSMFPPPERPPPVEPARLVADDIELTDDKAEEIRSLMAGFSLSLPSQELPPWVNAIGSGSVDVGRVLNAQAAGGAGLRVRGTEENVRQAGVGGVVPPNSNAMPPTPE